MTSKKKQKKRQKKRRVRESTPEIVFKPAPIANIRKIFAKKKINANSAIVQWMVDEPHLGAILKWVRTGYYGLDWLFGWGKGLPVGAAIEIAGPEGMGKSALCQSFVRSFQVEAATNPDYKYAVVSYHDGEQSLFGDYMRAYEIDPESFARFVPDSIETGMKMIGLTLKSAPDGLHYIVWDSVPRFHTKKAGDLGDTTFASADANAYAMQAARLYPRLHEYNGTMIWVNQLRTNMKARNQFDKQTRRPGGAQFNYNCVGVYELYRGGRLKRGDRVTGTRVIVRDDKNRVGPRFERASFILSYTHGPDRIASNREWLVDQGILKSGGKKGLKFVDTGEVFTKRAWRDFATENVEKLNALVEQKYAELTKAKEKADDH